MSYVFDSPANGSSNFQLDAGTLVSDLPPSMQSFTWWGTSSQPAIADVTRSEPGITVTGVLSGVSATADALTNVFGRAVSIQDKAASAAFTRQVQTAQLDLQKQQILGTLNLQQSQTAAQLQIEQDRVALSLANDRAKLSGGALSGTLAGPMMAHPYLLLAMLAGGYWLYKHGGAK